MTSVIFHLFYAMLLSDYTVQFTVMSNFSLSLLSLSLSLSLSIEVYAMYLIYHYLKPWFIYIVFILYIQLRKYKTQETTFEKKHKENITTNTVPLMLTSISYLRWVSI